MKSLLATTLVSVIFMSQAAMADDKAVYTIDAIDKIYFGKDQIRLLLSSHKKKGEFGCADPHYVIDAETFDDTFEQVVSIVTEAAINHAEIGFQVEACSGEGKEGYSVVNEVKVVFVRSDGRPGSYR